MAKPRFPKKTVGSCGPQHSSAESIGGQPPEQQSVTGAQPGKPSQADLPKIVRFLVRMPTVPVMQEYVLALIAQQFPKSVCLPLVYSSGIARLSAYWTVDIPHVTDPWETAWQLEAIDGIADAEPDLPRYTTVGGPEDPASGSEEGRKERGRRGGVKPDVEDWQSSPYIKGQHPHTPEGRAAIRKWSHEAVNFAPGKVAQALEKQGLEALAGLRIAQFDTGYTRHSKVRGGFDLVLDYDALEDDDDAKDARSFFRQLKNYGHGTRTGSILIGVAESDVPAEQEGNVGLLHTLSGELNGRLLLTPFRVARSVILLNRVSELCAAVGKALQNDFQVFTMSMGVLPGSALLYDLARTAYERGVIWCCAAGNVVQVVVAPAKYPGVICVAASNPNDAPWAGSCRGPEVDITAPGEFIYVPTLQRNGKEGMGYGNGTSYATPHVAAAATLWLAKNKQQLDRLYPHPWQRVEAFRYCLQHSARQEPQLPPQLFGAGILDVQRLLHTPLPAASLLLHAYTHAAGEERPADHLPLAVREVAYKDWQVVLQPPLVQPLAPSQRARLAQPGTSEKSTPALLFTQKLEASLGLQKLAKERTAGIANTDSAAAAYARVQAIHNLVAERKPKYAHGSQPRKGV